MVTRSVKKPVAAVLMLLAAVLIMHVSGDLTPSGWDTTVVKKFSKEGDK